MRHKYRVMICDDSERERQRFYSRQFDNFKIYGVIRDGSSFRETDAMDSTDKLHQRLLQLRRKRQLPDLLLLDLFYKKPLPNIDTIERAFIDDLLSFKKSFLNLKKKALSYLVPSGVDLLRRIREVDNISATELPIAVYTDKNFNFLPPEEFNILYRLDAGVVHKDRDEDPLLEISNASEYFHILNTIEGNRTGVTPKRGAVFITHGRSHDWEFVQTFLEDKGRHTVELAQTPSKGRTIIEKLRDEAGICSHAVIVMTAEDTMIDGTQRVRENVMHEIGYFQGRLGNDRVVLLHENEASIPTNLGGIVYIPYTHGNVKETFSNLLAELS